jgi:uncharacterized membrane protein required for colicin V production
MDYMYYVAIGIVIIVLVWRVAAGFKKGMVGEIISLISMIIALVSLAAILWGVGSYLDERVGEVIQMFFVLVVIAIVYKITSVIFTSMKLIAKLPVIKGLDKLLGAVLGAVEAVIIILILIQVLKYFSVPVPSLI